MEDPINLLDLNTATLNELKNLPGIGGGLAKRILATRPFVSYDDLRRVSGFGPSLLETLKSYATVIPPVDSSMPEVVIMPSSESIPAEPATAPDEVSEQVSAPESSEELPPLALEAKPPEEAPAPVQPELPSVEQVEPVIHELPETTIETESPPLTPQPISETISPLPAQSEPVNRNQLVMAVVVGGLVSTCLAFFGILVFLGILNGGYRYGRISQIRTLSNQVENIQQEMGQIQANIDSLTSQMSDLEGTSARLDAFESDFRQAQQEMQSLNNQLKDLKGQVDDLDFQMDALITRTSRFQTFLDGLFKLLQGLSQPEAP